MAVLERDTRFKKPWLEELLCLTELFYVCAQNDDWVYSGLRQLHLHSMHLKDLHREDICYQNKKLIALPLHCILWL